jgi:hypothetical protein
MFPWFCFSENIASQDENSKTDKEFIPDNRKYSVYEQQTLAKYNISSACVGRYLLMQQFFYTDKPGK